MTVTGCIHGLDTRTCALCQPRQPTRRPGWGMKAATPARTSGKKGIAHYDRECPCCGEWIRDGDDVVWDRENEVWICEGCGSE